MPSLCMSLINVRRVDTAPNSSGLQKSLLCAESVNLQTSPFCLHKVLLVFCYYFMRKGEGRNRTEQNLKKKKEEMAEKFKSMLNGERLRNLVAK